MNPKIINVLPETRSRRQRLRALSAALALTTLLAACGGGGGGSSGADAKAPGDGLTYSLGGTLTGLTASGLSLRNGSELLSPLAGATAFQFLTPIEEGVNYSVSVAAQPLGFVRCSAGANAIGAMGPANVTNVAVTCAQADAVVTTIAGTGSIGSADGTGTAASFRWPYGVAADSVGNLYVADAFNHKIRRVAPDGTVSTFAGSGTDGASDGPAASASFSYPFGVAVDAAGIVYVADWGNHSIRRISAEGQVSTLAGNGTAGSSNGSGPAASFNGPFGIAVDAAGVLYVADTNNNLIRRVSAAGNVTTLAGTGAQGADNGAGSAASFRTPQHLTVDAGGTVYVADTGNHMIRRISASAVVSTLAGTGAAGADNGSAATATFRGPAGIGIDASGTVFVADSDNNLIRRITTTGLVSTLAGSASAALADGINAAASFNSPRSIVVGADGNLVMADGRNHSLRRIRAQ